LGFGFEGDAGQQLEVDGLILMERMMSKVLIKGSLAAALATLGLVANAAPGAPFTIELTPLVATTMQVVDPLHPPAPALATLTISFDAPMEILGGALSLDWTPELSPSGLAWLPDATSVSSGAFSASASELLVFFDPSSNIAPRPNGVTINGNLTGPMTVGPDPIRVNLGFLGSQVGTYAVTASLTFTDSGFNEFSADAPTPFSVSVTAVPEPSSYALMVGGLAAVGALVRRRSRQA
jgi:hypothetical protein